MKLLKLVPDNTNIQFMRWRKVAMAFSVLIAIASLVLLAMRGLNLGVDFVGGQMITATFQQPIEVDELRERVGGLNLGDASIQEFGGPRSYQIRLPKPDGGPAAANRAASQVRAMLESEYPGARIDSVETVSGKVSEELAWDGGLAITLAMIGVAMYIWFRFEWHFGVGAIVTLAHDVSWMLGFFALTQMQVDLNIVAAFLAIVGYTLNDTVVIYDRIRENLRKFRKMAIEPLLDVSLNETLSRTVVTSLAVLLALGMLLAFGPETILPLTLAIFLGTVIGTYSSIYISAPMLLILGLKPDSFVKLDDETAAPRPA